MNIALKMDETGQAYLIFPGSSFTYIKIPWYESSSFINVLIILGSIYFYSALSFWGIDGIKWLRKRPPAGLPRLNTNLSRVAHWAGGFFTAC